MNMKKPNLIVLATTLTVLTLTGVTLQAATIPLNLPKPDNKPGDAKKPVKVYILAGQSNMVGMGDVSGARPEYASVFLSADPAVIPGEMPAGSGRSKSACKWIWGGVSALAKHGVYDAKASVGSEKVSVALGTVSEKLPALKQGETLGVNAQIDVPVTGTYTLHVGFEDSTYAVATVDGKEVYRKDIGAKPVITKVALEAGKRYPLTIKYFKSGSAALWLEQVDLIGKGDLVTLTKKDKKFPYLLDDKGEWAVRNDVYFQEARVAPEGKGSLLSVASNNGKSIGPEVGFGFVMGIFHDEQVLLIKTAMGNRSLGSDFRPPSSGRVVADSPWEGLEYRLMVKGVRQTLDTIDKVVPGYAGQGYEIAGFGWFQGHKDSGSTKEAYEKNLINLINDLRKEFNAPKMKAVVATVGFHGYRLSKGPWQGVWEAQMAVGDPKQHPELVGSVASVDTRDFWREVCESPRGQDYHYNRNPETYMLVGEAMGRAMVKMLGGEAEVIPKTDREAKTMADMAAEAAKPVPTKEQQAASLAAIKPMVLNGLMPAFVTNTRNQPLLQAALKGGPAKSAKASEYLDDVIDDVVAYYQVAGIDAYDWKPFGANIKDGEWSYFAFDVKNSPYKLMPAGVPAKEEEDSSALETPPAVGAAPKAKKVAKTEPLFTFTLPEGLANWAQPDFDVKQAGWKSGPASFGMKMDGNIPSNMTWLAKYPLYPLKRPMAKTIVENDILLIRKTIEVPPLKEGCRYRICVEGTIHDNSGEGFAVYVNGKLVGEIKEGVVGWRKQGIRGVKLENSLLESLKGGKMTIAVANFPMSNWKPDSNIPFFRPLNVWVEEQKVPALE
jgi:alpha-galactosidase